MSFGFDRQGRVAISDSIVLDAWLYESDGDTPIPGVDIATVKFTIYTPTDIPGSPTVNAASGTVVEDGHGQYIVGTSVNTIPGEYRASAQFVYTDPNVGAGLTSLTKSVLVDYEVYDPFQQTGVSPADPAIQQAWKKLQGNFDSEVGGPWLKDVAIATRFDQSTLRDPLLPEVLMAINQQMPFTDYDENGFPWISGDATALAAQGLMIAGIRHLIRSYTEQPNIVNSPVAFQDRRDYQARWMQTLQAEQAQFDKWLKQWKLRAYDLSHASILLGSKAGRMLPAPMRSRNFGRGF